MRNRKSVARRRAGGCREITLDHMATFRKVLEATGDNNVGIVVPESILLAFDRGKRVPVIVTIDGDYTYKTPIGVIGGRYLVSFNAETRKQTGRGAGDEVEVELLADPER